MGVELAETQLYFEVMRSSGQIPRPGAIRGEECQVCQGSGLMRPVGDINAAVALGWARAIFEEEQRRHHYVEESESWKAIGNKIDELTLKFSEVLNPETVDCECCNGCGYRCDRAH